MNKNYISADKTKCFLYKSVIAFDYYEQQKGNDTIITLRVLLEGGDQWYEGTEATMLYQNLLERANSEKLGTNE